MPPTIQDLEEIRRVISKARCCGSLDRLADACDYILTILEEECIRREALRKKRKKKGG